MQDMPKSGGRTGRVPPANRPGHHPEVEQDKPAVAKRKPRAKKR